MACKIQQLQILQAIVFKYQSSSFSYTKENKITDKKRARNKIPCSFFVLKYIFQNYLPLTEAYREIVQDANRR